MKSVRSITITAAQTDVKEEFSLPFSLLGAPEIYHFVGRKVELNLINEAFRGDGSQRKVVTLHGLGGIGKTQLAVAYMKEQRHIYSAIFWLNGKTEDTLRQSFAGMAERLHNEYPCSTLLKTAAREKNADQMIAAIKQWLSTKNNVRWMLVFDNVDNPRFCGIVNPQEYNIRSYFPQAHQGSILITTRSSRLKLGKVISVKKLTDIQESLTILISTSGRVNLDQGTHNHQRKGLKTKFNCRSSRTRTHQEARRASACTCNSWSLSESSLNEPRRLSSLLPYLMVETSRNKSKFACV